MTKLEDWDDHVLEPNASSAIDEWTSLGAERLLDLVRDRFAVHWLEVEALLAESDLYSSTDRPHVQPHHLSTARIQLLQTGQIAEQSAITRGGRSIKLLVPGNQSGISTKVQREAARKRLLAARYLSWASGSSTYPAGIIGPTGERVVRRSLVAAGTLRLIRPDGGPVDRLLGVSLAGPLDSGGLLPTGDFDNPGPVVAVPIEVKSVQDWIYPTSKELFQVLHKAATIQRGTRGDALVVPLLVCRRAHYTTFKMAKDLGFFVLDVLLQYVSAAATTEEHFDEVRNGLAFEDLRREPETDPRIVKRIRENLARTR